MNKYQKQKCIDNMQFNNGRITKCIGKKLPVNNFYKNDTLITLFDKATCTSCKKSKKCLKENFDDLYNQIILNKLEVKNTRIAAPKKNPTTSTINLKTDYKELEKLYNKALALAQTHNDRQVQEACKIFEYIISLPKNDFTGGCYATLGEIKLGIKLPMLLTSNDLNITQEFREIENHLKSALEIKPTNQIALAGIAKYYFYTRNYKSALNYIPLIKNPTILNTYLELVTSLHLTINLYKKQNILNSLNLAELIEFYTFLESYLEGSNYQLKINIIIIQLHLENNKPMDAYNLLKNMEAKYRHHEDTELFNRFYAEILSPMNLNRPYEALKYYEKIVPTNMDDKISLNTNKALCYIKTNEYDTAISILKKQLISTPNNTDFHNISRAYYIKGDLNNALVNIEKALSIYEDETSYLHKALIKKALGDPITAIKFAKKALYFIENENLNFSCSTGYISNSVLSDSLYNETYKSIFKELISAYIHAEQFNEGFALTKIAQKKFPYEEAFKENLALLQKFIDIKTETSLINSLLNEYESEKKEFAKQNTKMRTWMTKFIQYKELNSDINDLNTSSWGRFEKHIDKTLFAMKEYSKDTEIKFENIKNNHSIKFSKLSPKALECLNTAEYLYQSNKNSSIDFAPLVIEFSRIFEIELNYALNLKKEKTLGQIINTKILELNSLNLELEKIRLIRNNAAHTSIVSVDTVNELRNLIYKTKIIDNIIAFKENNV